MSVVHAAQPVVFCCSGHSKSIHVLTGLPVTSLVPSILFSLKPKQAVHSRGSQPGGTSKSPGGLKNSSAQAPLHSLDATAWGAGSYVYLCMYIQLTLDNVRVRDTDPPT